MAYLRRISGFVAILSLVALLVGANSRVVAINAQDNAYRQSPGVALAVTNSLKKSPALLEEYFASELNKSGIKLAPGTEHRLDSKPTEKTEKRCKSEVYQTLMSLPYSHKSLLSKLTLFYTRDGRRGLGGSGEIVLRCLNVTDGELSSVLVHEMGHLVDSGYLTGEDTSSSSGFYDFDNLVALDDPSLAFYKISWTSETSQKTDVTELDFVSTYATTDPFEDFAETYTYYRLHGPEFRELKTADAALTLKYDFMKNSVFEGKEFGSENISVDLWQRNYDVTVLPFPKAELFNNA
jgi:hypothetical protein